jgi:CDP-glycerol glycerophosphotransferase
MLFLAPDLERYRSERGFYLDYEAEVPGPILKTDADVIDALTRLEQIANAFAPKYDKWRMRFDSLEDGHSAERVVSIVWGN